MLKNLMKTVCCLTALSMLTASAEVKTLTDVLDREVQVGCAGEARYSHFFIILTISPRPARSISKTSSAFRASFGKNSIPAVGRSLPRKCPN